MAKFHPLTVTDIRKDTRDAVVVTLAPEKSSRRDFEFTQGQYLTFRRTFEGEELRRSYSICAGRNEGVLKVGIKRVDGGYFSNWANDALRVGDVIEAMPPSGAFFTTLSSTSKRHYLCFAGGSGITPVLSIIKTVLSDEPLSSLTLVYANRQTSSIMFREELEDLKNTFLDRIAVIHVLETEAQDVDLFTGRVDAEKCANLFKAAIDIGSVTTAFICGPEPMMLAIAGALKHHGLSDGQIKFELFASARRQSTNAVLRKESGSEGKMDCEAVVTIDGVTRTITFAKHGLSLLDAVLENSMDAPYACRAGVCSTCRAKVISGETEMETNHALEDYEVRQGYVLTCQCHPISDRIVITYDQ